MDDDTQRVTSFKQLIYLERPLGDMISLQDAMCKTNKTFGRYDFKNRRYQIKSSSCEHFEYYRYY